MRLSWASLGEVTLIREKHACTFQGLTFKQRLQHQTVLCLHDL